MKRSIVGIVAAAMVFAASLVWYSCTKEAEEENGSIYGIVTVTGEPLKGIGVSLFSGNSLLLKTVTYDDGHYEFSELKPGEYTLTVEAEGYKKFSTSVVVESGRQARVDMQLTLANTGLQVITFEAIVTGNTALLQGTYKYNSGLSPDEFGFYYSTSMPASSGIKIKTNDEEYNSNTSSHDFKVSVPNLSPGTYYVQAYAKNSYGTTFGDVKTFSVSGAPGVITLDATNVTQNTATLNGEIVFAGDPAYTERGFVYSSSFSNPTVDDPVSSTTRMVVSGTSTSFSANIDGLTEDVTYHVRAYATNQRGTSYGEQKTFATLNGLPIVETLTPARSNLVVTTGGNITNDGGYAIIERGVCYSRTPYPDTFSSHNHTSNGSGTGSYSSTFTMSNAGIYYVRAYAINIKGIAYGEQMTIDHPYYELPTFTYGGRIYRVAPGSSSGCCWDDAWRFCHNSTLYGFTDWKLPSKDELIRMYTVIDSIGGFGNNNYWSGTQHHYSGSTGSYYYYLNMYWGTVDYSHASASYFYRAVRIED